MHFVAQVCLTARCIGNAKFVVFLSYDTRTLIIAVCVVCTGRNMDHVQHIGQRSANSHLFGKQLKIKRVVYIIFSKLIKYLERTEMVFSHEI